MALTRCTALLLLSFAAAASSADWQIFTPQDGDLYPSALVAASTLKADEVPAHVLGDTNGQIGIRIKSPSAKCRIAVEVDCDRLFSPSRFSGVLPKAGKTYVIFPELRYDYDKLLALRQPLPETVRFVVKINDEPPTEKTARVVVRSINDCPYVMVDESGNQISTSWMFAAYINENHPEIDGILSEALDKGYVESFDGYQSGPDNVVAQVEAIWNVLRDRGFRYSSVTRESKATDLVHCQTVRLVGDSLRTAQANCVDGSVLFASILRKIDLNPFLVLIPGHMFLGVDLDEDAGEFICVETTMLGNSEFAEAVDAAADQFEEFEKFFDDPDQVDFEVVDVHEAREYGVLPLREPDAE